MPISLAILRSALQGDGGHFQAQFRQLEGRLGSNRNEIGLNIEEVDASLPDQKRS